MFQMYYSNSQLLKVFTWLQVYLLCAENTWKHSGKYLKYSAKKFVAECNLIQKKNLIDILSLQGTKAD